MISEVKATQRKSKKALFTSLPEEITENILARISRCNYPKLSLVSKSFHPLLSSTNIYKTPSQIGTTEPFLYVCLKTNDLELFTLQAKPNLTKTKTKLFKQKSSGNVLAPIASPSYPVPFFCTVAIGSELYFIGGPVNNRPSSAVRILDCRIHTWRDSPNMKVARKLASAVFLDDKLYVMGGCQSNQSGDWLEVFDIKTQSWTSFPSPCPLGESHEYTIVNVVQGKLQVVADEKDYIYDTKHDTWKVVRESSIFLSNCGEEILVSCVIENVIYWCTYLGDCLLYDSKGGKWNVVKGLEKLHDHRKYGLSNGCVLDLVNYGGNIVLVWDPKPDLEGNEIWFAEISLERRCNGSEIWGNVEWADVMLIGVPFFSFQHSLAV